MYFGSTIFHFYFIPPPKKMPYNLPFTKNISNLLYYICGIFYYISKFGAGCLELGHWLI